MFKSVISGLTAIFKDKYYLKAAAFAAGAFGLLYYWLFSKVTSVSDFFQMAQNGEFGKYGNLYAFAYWSTTIVTVLAFGVSAASLVWLWRHSKLSKAAGGSNALGAAFGALGAACPVCGAFLLSLLGVASGVSLFPFKGLELKFLSMAFIVGSTALSARRAAEAEDCEECSDISERHFQANSKLNFAALNSMEKTFTWILILLFFVNQFLISSIAVSAGVSSNGGFVGKLFGVRTAAAKTIIAPKLNPDGRTTSLVEQPTITDVPANPNSGDALTDAKVVMFATGKPFYAPDDISFDDPINAQKKWGAFEGSVRLSGEAQARYNKLIGTMVCSYCCGGPKSVTLIKQCGCAHAKAVRGFYKYMLQTYGNQYSDEQLVGESHRWYALWYPKGMLEDYLLATGKGNVLPHKTHGGAGADGRHGL
ncbi:hypothetical protein HYT45_02545 [Candidatus Uhrbacteria bacterium]|nr:hypothetical protein [Candidatus Uhrbacteria bacterium]